MALENRISDTCCNAAIDFAVDLDPKVALGPGDVRGIILGQHDHIRRLLEKIQSHATHLLATPVPSVEERETTRHLALALCAIMLSHIELENRILTAALENVDGWGSLRVERLRADHADQLALLRAYTHALEHEPFTCAALALAAWQLVEIITEDMEQEEASVLNTDLLSNAAIGYEVEAG